MLLSDALRLAPNSPEVLTLRGLVLFLSGKLAAALQHAASALRLDPGHEPALRLRKRIKDVERPKDEGNMVFKQQKWDDAIEKYTEALDVRSTSLCFPSLISRSGLAKPRKRLAEDIYAQPYFPIVQPHFSNNLNMNSLLRTQMPLLCSFPPLSRPSGHVPGSTCTWRTTTLL